MLPIFFFLHGSFHFISGQWMQALSFHIWTARASSAASKQDSTAHSTPRETHCCRRQGTQPAQPPGTACPAPLFFHLRVNLFPILFYFPCDSASNYFCHGRKDWLNVTKSKEMLIEICFHIQQCKILHPIVTTTHELEPPRAPGFSAIRLSSQTFDLQIELNRSMCKLNCYGLNFEELNPYSYIDVIYLWD